MTVHFLHSSLELPECFACGGNTMIDKSLSSLPSVLLYALGLPGTAEGANNVNDHQIRTGSLQERDAAG